MWIIRHKKSGYIFTTMGWISRLDVLPKGTAEYGSRKAAISAVKQCGVLDRTELTLDDLEVVYVVAERKG